MFGATCQAKKNCCKLRAHVTCLQTVCGCFYRGKSPENAEIAITGAILDVCENRSGASDKARGKGWGGGDS